MRSVKNLSCQQNRELQGLSLSEKLKKLHTWHENGLVTKEQMNYFSNRWIRKAGKKKMNQEDTQKPRLCLKTVRESELNTLVSSLKNRLRQHVANREKVDVSLSTEELCEIAKYLKFFSYLPAIDELLILGLRYPDKRLNKIASEYVDQNKRRSDSFWLQLWKDDFVPKDAVALMMDPTGDISSGFNPVLIRRLVPLIEVQRDKELVRLAWAETCQNNSEARKQGRIAAFNGLLDAARKI